jgi:hypothetical protein
MRERVRQCLGAMAIVAIALHGLLLGLAPLAAAASVDPFTVICHSVPQTAPNSETSDDQSPANPDIGVHGCDHCNLCSAAAAPAALDEVFAGQLIPARLLHVLRPVSTAATISLATTPKLAQGPPAFA